MLGQVQIREEIATRLKQARINAGFESVENFCQKNGLAMPQYSAHEDGSKSLKASQAMQYCKLLRVSLHWLILGDDNLKPLHRKKRESSGP